MFLPKTNSNNTAFSIYHSASNTLAFTHPTNRLFDIFQQLGVRDQQIDLNFILHIQINDFWRVCA